MKNKSASHPRSISFVTCEAGEPVHDEFQDIVLHPHEPESLVLANFSQCRRDGSRRAWQPGTALEVTKDMFAQLFVYRFNNLVVARGQASVFAYEEIGIEIACDICRRFLSHKNGIDGP